jgi:hypothetical protein
MSDPTSASWPDIPGIDTLKCSSDPPWADKVIYWPPTFGDEYKIEPVSGMRLRCDASRPEWKIIWKEWKEQKTHYIYLCERHAVYNFFLW